MSVVTATFSATVELPPVARSVPAARRVVGELLGAWAAEQYREDAVLLVSELATNVVRHVQSPMRFVLQLTLSEPGLQIAVADGSAEHPVLRDQSSLESGGRGMALIAALSHRWGSEEHAGGKRIWCELRGR